MSLENYSSDCIKKYLKVYRLILSSLFDDDINGGVGELNLYVKLDSNVSATPSRFDKKKRIKIGYLRYSVDEDERTLHIRVAKTNVNSKYKPNTSIKLFRVLLMHLLAMYSKKIRYVTLTAIPNDRNKVGEEFCLPCFYQELGFEPVHYDSKKMVKECIKQLRKNDEYCKSADKNSMCILCKCQRYGLPFDNVKNLRQLEIDMKALLPNLKKLLDDAYYHIDTLCTYTEI